MIAGKFNPRVQAMSGARNYPFLRVLFSFLLSPMLAGVFVVLFMILNGLSEIKNENILANVGVLLWFVFSGAIVAEIFYFIPAAFLGLIFALTGLKRNIRGCLICLFGGGCSVYVYGVVANQVICLSPPAMSRIDCSPTYPFLFQGEWRWVYQSLMAAIVSAIIARIALPRPT